MDLFLQACGAIGPLQLSLECRGSSAGREPGLRHPVRRDRRRPRVRSRPGSPRGLRAARLSPNDRRPALLCRSRQPERHRRWGASAARAGGSSPAGDPDRPLPDSPRLRRSAAPPGRSTTSAPDPRPLAPRIQGVGVPDRRGPGPGRQRERMSRSGSSIRASRTFIAACSTPRVASGWSTCSAKGASGSTASTSVTRGSTRGMTCKSGAPRSASCTRSNPVFRASRRLALGRRAGRTKAKRTRRLAMLRDARRMPKCREARAGPRPGVLGSRCLTGISPSRPTALPPPREEDVAAPAFVVREGPSGSCRYPVADVEAVLSWYEPAADPRGRRARLRRNDPGCHARGGDDLFAGHGAMAGDPRWHAASRAGVGRHATPCGPSRRRMRSCTCGARLLDISQTGVQILSEAVPPAGQRIWLRLERHGRSPTGSRSS